MVAGGRQRESSQDQNQPGPSSSPTNNSPNPCCILALYHTFCRIALQPHRRPSTALPPSRTSTTSSTPIIHHVRPPATTRPTRRRPLCSVQACPSGYVYSTFRHDPSRMLTMRSQVNPPSERCATISKAQQLPTDI